MNSENIIVRSRLHPVFSDFESGPEYIVKNTASDSSLSGGRISANTTTYARYQMNTGSENRTDQMGSVEVDSTTVMTDAAGVTAVEIGKPVTLSPAHKPVPSGVNRSIAEFLRKPFEVATGSFTTVFPVAEYDVMDHLATVDLYASKLKGFYGVKANPVYTMKITANRFTYGLFAISFLPTGGSGGGHAQIVDDGRSFTKVQRSQLLTAYMDLNCDSSVQLKIPWTSAYPYWQVRRTGLQTNLQSPGRLLIWQLSGPTDVSGGVTVATFSLYVHYENVELYGAAIPQGVPLFAREQSGGSVKRTTRGQKDLATQEMETSGPISGALSLVASAATALSSVPVLATIAQPVSWVADALARTANWFGYSAPRVVTAPTRMYDTPFPYLTTFDKHSVAEPLGLSVTNFVTPVPGESGTDFDEMSIDFIKSKSAWFATNTWTTSNGIGTLINSFDLVPRNFGAQQTDGTAVLYSSTPVAFLCRLFKFWRGSLILKIRFVKTEFHIGRLQIIYDPLAGSTPGAVTSTNGAHTYRRVFDLREGNEVDIVLPYISEMDWKYTDTASGVATLGRLNIYVDDQLSVSGGFAANSIALHYFISGGPDFAVASRKRATYAMSMPEARYQSGVTELSDAGPETCAASTTVFDNLGGHASTVNMSGACMGEVVLSLNQLLKAGGSVSTTGAYNLSEGTIQPYHYEYAKVVAGVLTVGQSDDPWTYLSGMFAFVRGGVRLTNIYFENTSSGITLSAYEATEPLVLNIVQSVAANPILYVGATGFNVSTVKHGTVAIDVPFNHILPVSVTNDLGFWTGSPAFTHTQPAIKSQIVFSSYTSSSVKVARNFILHRAGADDARFSCFVAIPPSQQP